MDPLRTAGVELVWFDSMGAKSMCTVVKDSVIIDPGAASMHPSYPLPKPEKLRLREEALTKIRSRLRKARVVIITHYHYDHVINLADPVRKCFINEFKGKTIYVKDPNKYINRSQWVRARKIFNALATHAGVELRNLLMHPEETDFKDPAQELKPSSSELRDKALLKGKEWFMNLAKGLWSKEPWLSEFELPDGTIVKWGDGRSFEFKGIKIDVLEPFFHGAEYSRTGWVTPILITSNNVKVLYTSDVMGPEITQYAERFADLKPDAVILDGPPTYMYPYLLNRQNLDRALKSLKIIAEGGEPQLIIYDHHLLRECGWYSKVREAIAEASRYGVEVMTAADYLGTRSPLKTACRQVF